MVTVTKLARWLKTSQALLAVGMSLGLYSHAAAMRISSGALETSAVRREAVMNIKYRKLLPDKFYELLPYLYSIAGVVMINYFESFIGVTLGFLSILFAGLIFLKRSDYRQHRVNMKY